MKEKGYMALKLISVTMQGNVTSEVAFPMDLSYNIIEWGSNKNIVEVK